MVAMAVLMAAALLAPPTEYPRFEDSPRCAPRTAPDWDAPCGFLSYMNLQPLTARPADRVYRVAWDMSLFRENSWFDGGSITLMVHADGSRFLKTPWRSSPIPLKKSELADFEALLARSRYAQMGQWMTTAHTGADIGTNGTEVCIDGVVHSLEAVVDGHYRLVYFDNCGVASENIALALDQLFVLAAAKSGHRWPFHPDHPTYRGS